jgi:hypothetical protein
VGKALGDATLAGDFPRWIESVGGSCRRAGFGRYFNRALMLSALVLLPFLLRRLRFLRADGGTAAKRLWEKLPWKTALIQTLAGCLIATGVLCGFASLLESPISHQDKVVRLLPVSLVMVALKLVAGGKSFSGLKTSSLVFAQRNLPTIGGSNLMYSVLSHSSSKLSPTKFLSNTNWRLPREATCPSALVCTRLTLFLSLQLLMNKTARARKSERKRFMGEGVLGM